MKSCRAWKFLKTTNDFTINSYLKPNLTNAVYLFTKERFLIWNHYFHWSLLNGVGSVGAWVRGWHGSNLTWVACVHKILAWVKKNGVDGMGRNFGVGGLGLRCFVKKVLLKISQNL